LVIGIGELAVFLSPDVGKGEHHGRGLPDPGRQDRLRQAAAQQGTRTTGSVRQAEREYGTALVVVNQPANIGALPLTVARDAGCLVAYLPGAA
jgi:hypothetical protein